MSAPAPFTTDDIRAAIEWWQAAGVDCDFSDDVTDWLADGAPARTDGLSAPATAAASSAGDAMPDAQTVVQKKVAPSVDLLGDTPPSDLDAFREFWMTAPGLDPIGPRGRVPPRGDAGAELMVLVVDPEETDSERLLSGQRGQLLDRILAAMGFAEDTVYFASALTRSTPMADTAALAQSGMRDVLLHHIALARPRRLIAFGTDISPLLGHEPPQASGNLPKIHHADTTTPLLLSEGLDSLMASPRLKARFWRRWIEWSGQSKP